MKTRGILLLALWLGSVQLISPQSGASSLTPDPRLALSTPEYRVTPGDIYTLGYLAGANQVTYTIMLDSTYRVRISNLGVIDASGKTFTQLKTQVETIVSNNYPLGGPQFVLTQPATFKVYIRGEVQASREIAAWALTRLSGLLSGQVTNYSSLRDISIRSAGGKTQVYDLYKSQRLGDISQDPYLRPNDVITLNRAERQITINGAVQRPGSYQLLPEEHLKDLIESYANGFTVSADKTHIQLDRLVNAASSSGDKRFLLEKDVEANYKLEDHDTILVPETSVLQPVIFVEGAVSTNVAAQATPASANRLVVPFNRGEFYGSLIRRQRSWFSSVSDTKNAYIIRGAQHIPINMNPMLYDEDYQGDILVEENDVLLIPFRQYFVSVVGAVMVPGRYPYIPDRTWDYYIALAGGLIREKNSRDAVDIVDISGKKLSKTDIISPETIITARTNSFTYYFLQYAPIVTTTLSVVATFLSIYLTVTR